MATAFACRADHVLPVAGTEAIIRRLPELLPATLFISNPTYGDYEAAWKRCHLPTHHLDDPTSYAPKTGKNTCTVVVCNPNNPDGRYWRRQQLIELYQRIANAGD